MFFAQKEDEMALYHFVTHQTTCKGNLAKDVGKLVPLKAPSETLKINTR